VLLVGRADPGDVDGMEDGDAVHVRGHGVVTITGTGGRVLLDPQRRRSEVVVVHAATGTRDADNAIEVFDGGRATPRLRVSACESVRITETSVSRLEPAE
jgi:hypothetical protein